MNYIFTGDVRHAARVRVVAESVEEAILKARKGDVHLIEQDAQFDFVVDTQPCTVEEPN